MTDTSGAASYQSVEDGIVQAQPAIERICAEVWELAEISLEEQHSAAVHLRELEAAGFTIVSKGTSGQATAFIAEWQQGEGGPTIGFLPEYDALPGLGNAVAPSEQAAQNGKTSGHGCGHNLLGAGCTGAAIALKAAMEADGSAGTLRVYGCAAEETTGAKVFMARDGLFDDLDACLAWHPAPIGAVGYVRTAAVNQIRVEFFGKTAHAGSDPWNGRSALDAVELFSHGLNLMREHVKPTVRIHYVVEAGGETPNVVPGYARMAMFIRDENRGGVEATTAWARELAQGAALGTQTRAEFTLLFGLHDLIPNGPLIERFFTHLQDVGIPAWSEEEQAFAKECQKNFGAPEVGMAPQPFPMLPNTSNGGASDVGDVSWNAPTLAFLYPTFPMGVGLHTWPVTACAGMSIGSKAAINTAKLMARLGKDLLDDPELVAAARQDFQARRGDRPYVSPLADANIGGAHITKDGANELVAADI